ncbi:hypothetical protein BJV78DRAFT_1158487 [Lactifluus subvellereus]|nr:hypothetical protein BJV78DRAFT_1158487 [Lactifluus subvellereus]
MSQAENILGPHAGEYMYITSIFNLSAIALLYYDYTLTLSREIQFLWPPHNKQGWFTLACLLNRYLPVFGYLPSVVSYFVPGSFPLPWSTSVPRDLSDNLADTRWHRRVLGLLLVLGSGSIIHAANSKYLHACLITAKLMMAAAFRSRGDTVLVVSSFHDCIQLSPPLGGLYDSLAWIGVLIFDSVIFSLTLYKAVTIGRGIQLLDVIVRDVNILMFRFFPVRYIAPMVLGPRFYKSLALNTALAKTLHCNFDNRVRLVAISGIIACLLELSTTLAFRLVLNLREQNSALAGLSTTVGTERRFQAAPLAEKPMTSFQVVTFAQAEESTSNVGGDETDGQLLWA